MLKREVKITTIQLPVYADKIKSGDIGTQKGYDQNQTHLLPPSLEEFVGHEHPARIISDVVDSIDISPTGCPNHIWGAKHSRK